MGLQLRRYRGSEKYHAEARTRNPSRRCPTEVERERASQGANRSGQNGVVRAEMSRPPRQSLPKRLSIDASIIYALSFVTALRAPPNILNASLYTSTTYIPSMRG